MDGKKLKAAALMAILIVHCYCLLFTVSVHKTFAATDTYSVENVVWINATGIGKAPGSWELIKLTIREEPKDVPDTKASSETTFKPNGTDDRMGLMDLNERQELDPGIMEFAGEQFKVTKDTSWGVGERYYNGTMIVVNSSEYYASFQRVEQSYPIKEKLILFDCPKNYAERYCDEGDYTLNNIMNSTYVETYDSEALNLFESRLVKTDYIITAPINTSALEAREQLLQYGGTLVQPKLIGWFVLLAVALAVIIGYFVGDYFIEAKRIEELEKTRRHIEDLRYNATIHAIDATTEIQLDIVGKRAAAQAEILEMFENGSITYEQCCALLDRIDAQYDNMLDNRTANIEDVLDNYYEHTDYVAGLGIGTSWTDYLYWIIILIVVLFSIYMVYTIIKRKGPKTDAGNVFIVQ